MERSPTSQLFLAKDEPLQASLPPRASTLLESLQESRKRYNALLEEKTQAPDMKPGGASNIRSAQRRVAEAAGDLDLNNPLSLHDEVRVYVIRRYTAI